MEEVLTETEIRTLYEKKQAEPFPVRKNVMGILIALIFILGAITAYLALWAFLMHLFGADRLPDDVITTATL